MNFRGRNYFTSNVNQVLIIMYSGHQASAALTNDTCSSSTYKQWKIPLVNVAAAARKVAVVVMSSNDSEMKQPHRRRRDWTTTTEFRKVG